MNSAYGFSLKHKNSKRVVFLLHGLTGSPFEMRMYGKHLYKAGYDVYCPVLPGHCSGFIEIQKSTWQDWYEFALHEYRKLKEEYDEVYLSGLCLGAVLSIAVAQTEPTVSGIGMFIDHLIS